MRGDNSWVNPGQGTGFCVVVDGGVDGKGVDDGVQEGVEEEGVDASVDDDE